MKTYNLFVSHSWKYADSYEKLMDLLADRSYFTFRNYSVPKDDPIDNAKNARMLEEAITAQMRPCSAILILAGVYSSYSKWINKEIEIAQKMSKPIISILPRGSEKTSTIVRTACSIEVKWNTESIVQAIRDYAL